MGATLVGTILAGATLAGDTFVFTITGLLTGLAATCFATTTGFAGALAAGFATALTTTGLVAGLAGFLELAFLVFLFSGMLVKWMDLNLSYPLYTKGSVLRKNSEGGILSQSGLILVS